MEKPELVKLTRRLLGDAEGRIWDDAELGRFIDAAARSYAADAECFHSTFPLFPAREGGYQYPDDYVCLLVAWNSDGENILPEAHYALTGEELEKKGAPKFIFDDLSNDKKFRVAPDPEELQDVQAYDIEEYGEIIEGGPWGVIDEGFGVVFDADKFTFFGDFVYVRTAAPAEVRDHMALVYHAIYQAYSTDAEFANAQLAQLYLQRYRRRVAMFGQIKHQNTGRSRTGNFF